MRSWALVMGLSILAIVPNKETLRALEAQAREEMLRSADNALYERRNASIEQERRVKENEPEYGDRRSDEEETDA